MDLPFTFHPEVLPATKQRLPPIGSKRPQDALRVVLTGAASDIGQKLTVLVCRGEAFGPKRFVEIVLVDKPRKLRQLREVLVPQIGQSMLPLVAGLYCTHDLAEAFEDAAAIFLCSGMVPFIGVKRMDAITINAAEFKEIGLAIEKVISNRIVNENLKVLVVTEPPCSNMHVLLHFAPSLNPKYVMGLSRVDQNRAKTCIARRLDISCDKVRRLTVWGNKSSNIYFDLQPCVIEINGAELPAVDAIKNDHWIKNQLIVALETRQADIERRRRATLCLPVAAAAAQHMHDWSTGTAGGDWASMIVSSDGSYGIEPGLAFSFPVRVTESGWEIVRGLRVDDHMRDRLDSLAQEIKEEKSIAFQELKVIAAQDDNVIEKSNEWRFGDSETPLPCSIQNEIDLRKVRLSTGNRLQQSSSHHFGGKQYQQKQKSKTPR